MSRLNRRHLGEHFARRVRLPRDDAQIGLGRCVRFLSALLPITERANRNWEGSGEILLAEL